MQCRIQPCVGRKSQNPNSGLTWHGYGQYYSSNLVGCRQYDMALKILHLEDNAADAELVRRVLMRSPLSCEVLNVTGADEYQAALAQQAYDVILSDSGIPGYDGRAALLHAHTRRPGVPFIVVSGRIDENQKSSSPEPMPAAQVAKARLERLPEVIESTLQHTKGARESDTGGRHVRNMQYLVAVIQALSLARSLDTVMDIVRHAARKLVGADGASFVLRDGDCCYYAQEDAITPLWKGQRFPISACIGGWSMLNRRPVAIGDIYQDARIPHDDYRPTFVKSLLVAPIRTSSPVGAIAVYWAQQHVASKEEIELLSALADSTSVAMEAVDLITNLEQRVAERTEELHRRKTELEALNKELEAFSYSVAHDLRSPLITIDGFSRLLVESCADVISEEAQGYVVRITAATARMQSLINDLLALSKIVRAPMNQAPVDLSKMAGEIAASLAAGAPERNVEFICDHLSARADPGMMRVMLENLLANAWKFTSKTAQARVEFGLIERNSHLTTFFVRDNGAGFDPRYCSNLFSPFHRLHSQDQFPGAGVGLATARRIINRHGGEIRADGEVNKGAVFYFSLPSCEL
jgi:signal transduction histidine kinase/CheY-like chemotaxis protein